MNGDIGNFFKTWYGGNQIVHLQALDAVSRHLGVGSTGTYDSAAGADDRDMRFAHDVIFRNGQRGCLCPKKLPHEESEENDGDEHRQGCTLGDVKGIGFCKTGHENCDAGNR